MTQVLLTHTLASGAVCTLFLDNPGAVVPEIRLVVDPHLPEGRAVTLTSTLSHTDGRPPASVEEGQDLVARLDAQWIEILGIPAERILRDAVAELPAAVREEMRRNHALAQIVAICKEMIPS